MIDRFDVAVVGAGPAGATAARELAERNLRTVLIERASLPRYKTCAGGVPLRTAALLPFAIDSVVEDAVDRMAVSFDARRRYVRRAAKPFAYMTMRARLDALLAERAAGAGAQLRDRTTLRSLTREGSEWRLETDRGAIFAGCVIGADGANSLVARASGLGRGMTESVAMEAEIRAAPWAFREWRRTVGIDFGYHPRGYAWVFPKQELLSLGLVLPASQGGAIRDRLAHYVDLTGLGSAPVERLTGHKVLSRRGPVPIAGDGVALVGDAAGLADEFSEEGIYYAVRSGQLAADAVVRAGGTDLRDYERAVNREIQSELDAARTIAELFYASLRRWPWAVMTATHHVGYLWEALFRVQRGESSYDRELARLPRLVKLLKLAVRP